MNNSDPYAADGIHCCQVDLSAFRPNATSIKPLHAPWSVDQTPNPAHSCEWRPSSQFFGWLSGLALLIAFTDLLKSLGEIYFTLDVKVSLSQARHSCTTTPCG